MKTYASTPGRFRFSFAAWARCFPGRVAFLLMPALVFACLPGLLYLTNGAPFSKTVVIWWATIPLALRMLLPEIALLHRKCREGNVNAAVVISLSPCLIAVSTDMAKRAGEAWPVIKILPQPLGRTHGPRPQIGDRLPAVALYRGTSAGPHWGDFFPNAVACLSDDPEAVQGAMRRLEVDEFGPDHWERLAQNLARVPTPRKPGLYWMQPG